MTRAILEGIHEVELEITPEFQKNLYKDLLDAFDRNGWVKDTEYQHGSELTYVFKHPSIPGASASFVVDVPHQMLMGNKIAFQASPNGAATWLAAKTSTIDAMTKAWTQIEGEGPEISTTQEMLKEIGWETVKSDPVYADPTLRAVVFSHPEVKKLTGKMIRVVYRKIGGDLVSAVVVYPDDKVVSLPDDVIVPELVRQAAYALLYEAGQTKKGGGKSELDQVRSMLGQLGWQPTKGYPMHGMAVIDFVHPKISDEYITTLSTMSGDMQGASTMDAGGGSKGIKIDPPSPGNIYGTAQAIMIAKGL